MAFGGVAKDALNMALETLEKLHKLSAVVEQIQDRITDFRDETRKRIGDFEARLDNRANAIEARVESRIDRLEARIVELEARVASVQGKTESVAYSAALNALAAASLEQGVPKMASSVVAKLKIPRHEDGEEEAR
jgi:chromosome segregation ATPase